MKTINKYIKENYNSDNDFNLILDLDEFEFFPAAVPLFVVIAGELFPEIKDLAELKKIADNLELELDVVDNFVIEVI